VLWNAVPEKLYKPHTAHVAELLARKPFFKIGEVARLLGVKPHVLRYWETEFPSLRPKKNPSGQRIYARADIDALVEIKNLLYNERYTISGAKRMLAQQEKDDSFASSVPREKTLAGELGLLRDRIQELLTFLQHGQEG
jgi:DNA-binding transcriptional MerR regulator